jgi:hypothetical protein
MWVLGASGRGMTERLQQIYKKGVLKNKTCQTELVSVSKIIDFNYFIDSEMNSE